jgi:hypothetical protein
MWNTDNDANQMIKENFKQLANLSIDLKFEKNPFFLLLENN